MTDEQCYNKKYKTNNKKVLQNAGGKAGEKDNVGGFDDVNMFI